MLLAAAGGAALIFLSPWMHTDQDAAGRIHRALGGRVTPVVAVAIDRADERRLALAAAEAGALAVRGAADAVLPLQAAGAPGDVREVDGAALLAGSVPFSLLSGTIVVLDTHERARARADALARVALPEPGFAGRAVAALTAAMAAALVAWAAARARLRATLTMLALAALAATGAMAIAAAGGLTLPGVELALVAPAGAIGGCVDAALDLR